MRPKRRSVSSAIDRYRRLVGDVEVHGQGASAPLLDHRRRLFDGPGDRLAASRHDDIGALLGKLDGNRAPDAATASGHDCDASFELLLHGRHRYTPCYVEGGPFRYASV